MKRRFLAILLTVAMLLPIGIGGLSVQAAGVSANAGSSASAPEGYSPHSNNAMVQAVAPQAVADANVLLIQDNLPWDSNANELVLKKLGVSYQKITTAQFASINLWDYDMAVIANDQTFATYQNFKDFKSNLDLFANLGGVIVFGASDSGWANGTFDWDLPGGLKKISKYTYKNVIADTTHPIVTGVLTDNNVLVNDDLYEKYCSHGDFVENTLPRGAKVILRSADTNAPTLVEYPLGSGYVIASTLTWEFNYVRNVYGRHFAEKSMDDLFAYGLSLCSDAAVNGRKMEINRDNNSFSHSRTDFFQNGEAQQYLMEDQLFDKLNSFYDENWYWEALPFTNNQIQKQRVAAWGGSCFGISASMALVYMNEVGLVNFDADASDYFHADKPKDNARFRSLINYYQLAQYVPAVNKKEVTANISNASAYKKELETIVNMAKQSNTSNVPFIFTFGWTYLKDGDKTSAGHAIVCIGVEENSSYYRLKFIDPNSRSYVYAQVLNDYSSIAFESTYKDPGGSYTQFRLTYVGHDTLSILAPVDIDGSNNVLRAQALVSPQAAGKPDVFMFNSDTAFEIKANDGKILRFDGAEISGTLQVLQLQHYEKGESTDFEVAVESHSSYTITLLRDHIDISIYNENGNYYAFSGTNAKTIQVDMSKGLSANGSNMNYDVFFGGINGNNTDMIRLSNQGANAVALLDGSNSVSVTGDKLANSTVIGFYGSQIYRIENSAQDDQMSVSKNNVITDDNVIRDGNVDPSPTDSSKQYFKLWGKTTKWEKTPLNWFLCIVLFGWIWMAF